MERLWWLQSLPICFFFSTKWCRGLHCCPIARLGGCSEWRSSSVSVQTLSNFNSVPHRNCTSPGTGCTCECQRSLVFISWQLTVDLSRVSRCLWRQLGWTAAPPVSLSAGEAVIEDGWVLFCCPLAHLTLSSGRAAETSLLCLYFYYMFRYTKLSGFKGFLWGS